MGKKFRNLIFLFICLFFVFIPACNEKEKTDIKIAFIGPFSGDNAVFGVPQKNAALLAVDKINKNGGINGKEIQLITEDDMGDPKAAVSAAQKIVIDKNIVAVVGHPNSGCAIPASKIYNENKILFITSTATNPALTMQGFSNVFRFAPTDDMQGFSIAEFVFNYLNLKNIVLLHDNGAYGKGIERNVKKRYLEIGGNILFEDAINPKSRDFKAILNKIKKIKPEIVFYGGMLPEGTKLVKQSKEINLDTLFVFGDGCYDESFIKLAGTSCENVYISFLAAPVEEMTSAKEFYFEYKERFGDVPSFFTPYAYDAINLIADIIIKSKSISRGDIMKTIQDQSYSFNGITGKIKFNKMGQTTDRSFYFYNFNNKGKLSLAK